MRHAGVREARQNLSVLLGYVARGHEVLITDRGRPVARLVAPLPLSAKGFASRAAFRRGMPVLRPPLSATLASSVGAEERTLRWSRRLPGPMYLDGTGLAKLYFPEPDSAAMDRALRGRRDVTVSDLAVTELMTAYAVRHRGERAMGTAARLQAAVLQDMDSGCFRRVELSPATHRAAERLALSLSDHADAGPVVVLHLALAMTVGVAGVLTVNPILARAAEALGLLTLPSL